MKREYFDRARVIINRLETIEKITERLQEETWKIHEDGSCTEPPQSLTTELIILDKNDNDSCIVYGGNLSVSQAQGVYDYIISILETETEKLSKELKEL